MNKICLCILYNSSDVSPMKFYERQYFGSFDKIYHIVPLYRGKKDNVISVFENKEQISGYIAQAFDKIYSKEYSHYIFMQDNCVLNQDVNSQNVLKHFKLDDDTCFISDDIFAVNYDTFNEKLWALPSIYNHMNSKNGAQVMDFVPKKAEARRKFSSFGVKTPHMFTDELRHVFKYLILNRPLVDPFYFRLEYGNMNVKTLLSAFTPTEEMSKRITVYPYVASEAKFFIIPNKTLKTFSRYCGIYAALRLHYNIAIATAMCFSAEKIVMKKDLTEGLKIEDFNKDDCERYLNLLARKYNYNLGDFLEANKKDTLISYPWDLKKWVGAQN